MRAYGLTFEEADPTYDIGAVSYKALEIVFPHGSRITALPANPDTARGFSANVFLDEFAFHKDSGAIWKALFPVISAGWKQRVTSTPNGKSGKFYELDTAGDDTWSRHSVDICQAVANGLPRDIDALRAGIADHDAWAQEYELKYLDEASAWLSYELISSVEDEVAIDGELASIAIEYEARYNQSALAFATALARRYNAVAKSGSGKLVFTKKGSATSSSGEKLPQVAIARRQCASWDFELEPRPRHGRVVAKWFDRAAGKLKFETVSTGGKGPLLSLPHTYRTQAEAKQAAEAEGTAPKPQDRIGPLHASRPAVGKCGGRRDRQRLSRRHQRQMARRHRHA